MICAQCHHENAAGDKFCEQCGAPLEVPAAPSQEDNIGATMIGGPPASVVLVRADDPSQTFPLDNRVVVGRLDSCDIPIHDKSVSREHARLSQLPGGYVVEDLGSTNGTLVNGERVADAVILRAGDSVTFGSIEFLFQEEASASPEPASAGAQTQAFEYPSPAQGVEDAPQTAEPERTPEGPVQSTDVPAFEFPPIQPFAAPPEAQTQDSISVPFNLNSTPTDAVSQDAPSPAIPSWPVDAPAPGVPWAQPATAADAMEQATAPPEAPPPSPAADPWPTSTPSPAREVTSEPSAVADTGDSKSVADEAVALAGRLTDLVHSLSQHLNERDSHTTQMEQRLHELESTSNTHQAVTRTLRDVPPPSMSGQQLQATQDALDQLIQNPRDIEILMQLGRQAADLAAIVNEYGQLRRLLQRMQNAVEGP